MELLNNRRISDVSFTIDKEMTVTEGNRSFLRLFNINDSRIVLSDFMDARDGENFRHFLLNFAGEQSEVGNPYFIARISPDKPKMGAAAVYRSCLFYVERKDDKFSVDVKELSYSKQLLDSALLESREYKSILSNFDTYYFLFDGEKFTFKNTKDLTTIFEGGEAEFREYLTNTFSLEMTQNDTRGQFESMIKDALALVSGKIYKFIRNDKKIVSVHTTRTSTRSTSIVIGIVTADEEKGIPQNIYSETRDGLTELYNKVAITDIAMKKVNDNKNPVALIVMDVDKFKECNDTFGHAFGDKVLVLVSTCIREAVAGIGVAGRIGGDEFLIVLDKTSEEDIRNVARNIRIGLKWSIEATEPGNVVTCSMGIARFPKNAKNYDELFNLADKCLYIAKSKGRDCYIIYKPEIHDSVIIDNEKKAKEIDSGHYYGESSDREAEILKTLFECDGRNNDQKIQSAVEALAEYIQVNKVTVYKKQGEKFVLKNESERLLQKTQAPHGDFRQKFFSQDYFRYFNESDFLHLDNTGVLDALDKKKYLMYMEEAISSTIEMKTENALVCYDIYKPARTFPKEKIIFALLTAKLISERL